MKKYYRKWITILLLQLSRAFSPVFAAPPNEIISEHMPPYRTTNWRVADGLPYYQIYHISQTKNGYIWLATENGLARFNGFEFENFNTLNTQGLANNRISTLFEDSRGRLWIGHDDGSITIRTNETFSTINLPEQWEQNPVLCFMENQRGTVWAIGHHIQALSFINGQPPELHKLANTPQNLEARHNVVIGTERGRITSYTPENLPTGKRITTPPEIEGRSLRAFPGRNGKIWILANRRLRCLENGRWARNIDVIRWESSTQYTALYECTDGSLIISSTQKGTFIYTADKQIHQLNSGTGLKRNRIYCMFEDSNGTVWAGTGSGLSAIRPARYSSLITANEWDKNPVISLTPRQLGGLWVGTVGNGIMQIEGNRLLHLPPTLSFSNIFALQETDKQTLWFNANGRFLNKMTNFTSQEIPPPINKFGDIRALCADHNGHLWVGGQQGIAYFNGTEFYIPTGTEECSNVQCITEGKPGEIWFGTAYDGLSHIVGNTCTLLQGLLDNNVRALSYDPTDDTLWIGSGTGISMLQSNRISTVASQKSLSGSVISLLIDDQLGRLWARTANGIAIFEKQELRAKAYGSTQEISPLLLDASDGYESRRIGDHLQTGCRTEDGMLHFSTGNGIVSVNPATIQRDSTPVPLLINEILANNRPIETSPSSPLRLSPDTSLLRFNFTSLNFIAPHRIKFRYRLIGHDEQWMNATENRSASFLRLSHGQYRFELTACNHDGVWNENPLTYSFSIAPHFWQTWSFRIGVVSLAALFVCLLSLAAADRINRPKLIRAEKLRAVELERTRISMDIHDEIGAGLTHISLLSHLINSIFSNKEGSEPPKHIRDLERVATELVASLDEIVWVITPKNDTLSDLCAYLEKYVTDYLAETGIQCRLDIPIQLPNWNIPGPARHNIYLVLKEAINNIVKHAEADAVEFSASIQSETLRITIHDNGTGLKFKTETSKRHGLSGMTRRMTDIGGDFEIYAAPEGGSIVHITYPQNRK